MGIWATAHSALAHLPSADLVGLAGWRQRGHPGRDVQQGDCKCGDPAATAAAATAAAVAATAAAATAAAAAAAGSALAKRKLMILRRPMRRRAARRLDRLSRARCSRRQRRPLLLGCSPQACGVVVRWRSGLRHACSRLSGPTLAAAAERQRPGQGTRLLSLAGPLTRSAAKELVRSELH